MKIIMLIVSALVLPCIFNTAEALQRFSGTVKEIEATYMPTQIPFTLSEGNSACPKGKTLFWANANLENNKAVYATLLTSLTTGRKIMFIMDDDDASCKGRFIYITE
ncbi:hypothetical protein [Xanthomonas arboricola]|uniref:hypothetical protein n=1 Tax=Xanthomonas arboricola TaxID=56448 RepID=UPI000E1EDBDC|nr:hypothetical protein [Xanthomonas arboricola]